MTDKKNKGTDPKTYKFDTLSLHAGYQPHKNAGSRQVPIYQTTSYLFDDVDHAAALFNLERGGHIYSRISNPTVAVLEERVAEVAFSEDVDRSKLIKYPELWAALKRVVKEVRQREALFKAEPVWWPKDHHFENQESIF